MPTGTPGPGDRSPAAAERATHVEHARRLVTSLANLGVAGVALTYVDNAGITRVKTIPLARLPHAAAWGIGMSPVFDVFCVDDSITAGRLAGGPTGDLRLYPDLDRLTPLAAQPGWAWAPVDRYTQDGNEHPGCHRRFARHMATRAADAGLRIQIGFETEWVVAQGSGDGFRPACTGPAYGMTRLMELSDYCRDILTALARQSIEVHQLHPEYGPGQFEVSVAPADPVTAADVTILVRETIRAVTRAHDMTACFAPTVAAGSVGNGAHVHLSLHRNGHNLLTGGDRRYGMTPDGEAFLAGVLTALPALVGIGAPSVSSYIRLVPSHWAGAFQCWGRENREAAIRLITGSVGEQTRAANAEVKCLDASASPYLVVGALLAVGLAGLEQGLLLPVEVTGDPATLPAEERERLGVQRLPDTLAEATTRLEENETLRRAMGEHLFDAFLAVRRAEIALFAGKSADEIVAATRWRY